MTNTNYTELALSGTILGWQSPQNDRGTWDIIWSSLQTLTLCAWVSVCTNAASPVDGSWDIIRDKFYFVLMTCLGPEFIFLLAFGQWQTARASVDDYHDAGYKDWTIMHSFYADMGGIHVKSRDFPSFPVNARQLLYLLKKQYIELPPLTKSEIKGLGKSDDLAKLITVVQASWFLLTTSARLVQGLAVTTLEMTVLANIFCTLATYVCWWDKPTDVSVVHFYELKCTITTIIREAGNHADGEYRDTPLDFVSRREWGGSLLWNYYVNILQRLALIRKFKTQQPPVQKFTTFNFPRPSNKAWASFLLLIGMAYASFFIAAWNFYFPSQAEQQLWRVAVLAQCIIASLGSTSEIIMLDRPIKHMKQPRQAVERSDSAKVTCGPHRIRDLWDMPCNNELTGNFPCLDVPLRSVLIMTPVCATYVLCRFIILAEDCASLRSLPASAYENIDWSKFLPWV